MIEINLLPEELRRPEGTPLPRFLSVVGSVLLVGVGLVFVIQYYFFAIPAKQAEIVKNKKDKAKAEEKVKIVQKLDKEIAELNDKLKAFEALEGNRVLYGRILSRIMLAVPNGCWLRSMKESEDRVRAGMPGQGAAHKIIIKGFTRGADRAAMAEKFSVLLKNLERLTEANKKRKSGINPAGAGAGNKKKEETFLRVVFGKPRPEQLNFKELKPDDKLVEKADAPRMVMAFEIQLPFSLPQKVPEG